MKKFKYLPSVKKGYDQQGELYFACKNYERQSKAMQKKIKRLCEEAAGEYSDALFAYLTTDISWQETCARFYLSERALQLARARFYRLW